MMKSEFACIMIAALLVPAAVIADEVVPIEADRDGLEQFERNVTQGMSAAQLQAGARQHPSNFGAAVSAEARKLKAAGQQPRGDGFGQWVSNQRRHSNDPSGSAAPTTGTGNAQGSPASSLTTLPNGLPFPGNGHGFGHGNGHRN